MSMAVPMDPYYDPSHQSYARQPVRTAVHHEGRHLSDGIASPYPYSWTITSTPHPSRLSSSTATSFPRQRAKNCRSARRLFTPLLYTRSTSRTRSKDITRLHPWNSCLRQATPAPRIHQAIAPGDANGEIGSAACTGERRQTTGRSTRLGGWKVRHLDVQPRASLDAHLRYGMVLQTIG